MKASSKWYLYLGGTVVIGASLLYAGKKEVETLQKTPITVESLFSKLSKEGTANYQVIDTRRLEDEESESGGYEETHIPGSIPFPDCDMSKATADAKIMINPYLPTVIVSEDGDQKVMGHCLKTFKLVQNVSGGIAAWVDKGYPEDEGSYAAPPVGGGGGCL